MAAHKKIDLGYAIRLKPEKAIEYFKAKGFTFSWDWRETMGQAHARAFTVAKVMRMDILQDIRNEVQMALDEGTTLAEFKKRLTPVLQNKGWWGRKLLGDGKGGAEEVQLGSPRRLETIYRTNLQSAYMAGRVKDMSEDTDSRPYWQYVAVMDMKTRPGHAAMNGKVFRHDDPFWSTVGTPPYDYACRCRVRALTDKNLTQRGLKAESSAGQISQEDVLLSKQTGEMARINTYKTTDPVTGKPIVFRPGAGFDYNKAKAAWQPDLNKYDYPVAKKYVEGAVTGPDFTRFFRGTVGGQFPVAVLSEEYRRSIGAKSQTVLLSDETLAKNKGMLPGNLGHPELTIAEYQKIPNVIENAQAILQDGELTLAFIKLDNRFYQAVVKTTKSGETLFLTSFRRMDNARKEIERLKRNKAVKVLKDEL